LVEGSAVDLLLANDLTTGSRVVLEGVREELSPRPEIMNAVLTEAYSRRRLQHPFLHQRERIIVSKSGRRYWVSGPVTGETLRWVLDTRRGLEAREAVQLMIALCEAVAYLHERGYVHGSLCPAYVLVDQVRGRLCPKLLDSGLTLLRVPLRILGRLPSTLVPTEYLSPERVRGRRADELSDIYALGTMMYELLVGHAPYSGTGSSITRQRHLNEALPSLPAHLKVLEPAIHGCLAKQPGSRFQRVAYLRQALEGVERQLDHPREELAGPPEGMSGQLLGSYRVVRQLGEGASGFVYLAVHPQHGEVAIKVLRPEHAFHPEMVARFFLEANAANRVRHPNIVEIHDFVEPRPSDDGPGYLVMEYLKGQTLSTLVRDKQLPLSRTLDLVIQVCDALEAAHRAGVVHRDVKPENIFIVDRGDGRELAKVVDFGIAKLVWGADAQSPLTLKGEVLGTPAYMAPEQLAGKAVDARTDIYAVGTVLYRLLSGRRPFTGSLGDLLAKLQRDPPPPLEAMTASGEPFPMGLRQLILQCMEKNPKARPGTMRELANALSRFAPSRNVYLTAEELLDAESGSGRT
jgi:serine/threonine protein kinase